MGWEWALIWVWLGGGGDGRLFEAGRLLTFSAFRMGAYSGVGGNSRLGAYSNKYDILLTIPTKRCLASYSSSAESVKNSRYVRVSAFRSPWNSCLWNPESEKFFLWNLESWSLESGIQLKESRIPCINDWNSEFKLHWQRLESRIQSCLGFS